MATTAFEAITTRNAWYASAATAKYAAVEFNTSGKYVLATGVGVFGGIVEYGCDDADEIITVVRGVFPALCSANVTAGTKLTIDAANAGKFKAATTGTIVYGIAMNDGTAGELVSIAMADVPFTVA